MTQAEKINYLIREYKNGNYTTEIFCDQFVCILFYEEDDSITKEEYQQLREYAEVFARFSPFEEDLRNYPNTYFDEETIKKQIDIAFENMDKDVENNE